MSVSNSPAVLRFKMKLVLVSSLMQEQLHDQADERSMVSKRQSLYFFMLCAVADENPELPGVVHPAAEEAPPAHPAGAAGGGWSLVAPCHLHVQVEEEHSAILDRLEARLGGGDQVTRFQGGHGIIETPTPGGGGGAGAWPPGYPGGGPGGRDML